MWVSFFQHNINRQSFKFVGGRTRWLKVSNGSKDSVWRKGFISLQSDSWVPSEKQITNFVHSTPKSFQNVFDRQRFITVWSWLTFESIHLLFERIIRTILSTFCTLFQITDSFSIYTFWSWYKADLSSSDIEGQHGHGRSSRCLQLKRLVWTCEGFNTLIPEEDCGLNGWNREKLQLQTCRETEGKTQQSSSLTNFDSPHCRHSFPAFQSAWVGSRVSSDDFNSGEGCWCNKQPSVMPRIPRLLTRKPLLAFEKLPN